MKILIRDIESFGDHAFIIKNAIELAYGSSLDITIEYGNQLDIAGEQQRIRDAVTDGYDIYINSAINLFNFITTSIEVYPDIVCFFPLGSNSFIQVGGEFSGIPTYLFQVVTSGSGDTQNRTAYGYALEFWDDDTITPGSFESSYSNGTVLGKILKIRDTLDCTIWEARYRAHMTADRNEPNRLTSPWDLRNGFGKINPDAAIAYTSEIIADPYIDHIGTIGSLTASFSGEVLTINLEAVDNAATYEIYYSTDRGHNYSLLSSQSGTSFSGNFYWTTYYKYKAKMINAYGETEETEFSAAVPLIREKVINILSKVI